MIENDKKYDFYCIKIVFQLVFDNGSFFKYVTCKLKDNRTRFCLKRFLENFVVDFSKKGHNLKNIEEIDVVTVNDKRDRTYEFYLQHNLCLLECLIKKKLKKLKNLKISSLDLETSNYL